MTTYNITYDNPVNYVTSSNNLTISGGSVSTNVSSSTYALHFFNSGSYIRFTPIAPLNLSRKWTFAFWVKVNDVPSSGFSNFLSLGTYAFDEKNILTWTTNDLNGVVFDKWVHIALINDSSDTVRIYRDAVFKSSVTSFPPIPGPAINIGGTHIANNHEFMLDDVRYFDYQLSISDLQDLANNSYTAHSPSMEWTFESMNLVNTGVSSSYLESGVSASFENADGGSSGGTDYEYVSGQSPATTFYSGSVYNKDRIFTGIGSTINYISSSYSSSRGSIAYQLSNDAQTWYYWNGSLWTSALDSQYNTEQEVNDNISKYNVMKNLYVKTYLLSNNTSSVELFDTEISITRPTKNVYTNFKAKKI